MPQHKSHTTPLGAAEATDRWYITNGRAAVGPVTLELLRKGVEAGKVPDESYVRHEKWKVWRPLGELLGGTASPPPVSREELAASTALFAPLSQGGELAGPGAPYTTEEEPVDPDEKTSRLGRIGADGVVQLLEQVIELDEKDLQPVAPGEEASDPFARAGSLREGLRLLLSLLMKELGASAGLVHEATTEGAAVLLAEGGGAATLLGERLRLLDPVLMSASAGVPLLAEPTPGPAGSALLERLGRLSPGERVASAFMLPIRPHGRLRAVLELGRREPFRPAEFAKAAESVDALVLATERQCWA